MQTETILFVFVLGMAAGTLVPKALALARQAAPAVAKVSAIVIVGGLTLFGAYNVASALLR